MLMMCSSAAPHHLVQIQLDLSLSNLIYSRTLSDFILSTIKQIINKSKDRSKFLIFHGRKACFAEASGGETTVQSCRDHQFFLL